MPQKPPRKPVTIPSDSFTVEEDGITYRPHEGEYIVVRGKPSIGLWVKLRNIKVDGEEAFEGLAKLIPEWTWTDEDGDPYPSPPTGRILGQLSDDEISWIVGAVASHAPPATEEGAKN